MSAVMGVMVVLMIVGFLGFGHNHGKMGGHDKGDQKGEAVLHEQDQKHPCLDCPIESGLGKEEDGDDLQGGE